MVCMAGAVTSAFAIFISTFSPNVPFLMLVYGVLGNYTLAAFFFLFQALISVADPLHFGVDPDPDPDPWIHASGIRILLFSSLTFKMAAKKIIF
jgi:hypothetical protein